MNNTKEQHPYTPETPLSQHFTLGEFIASGVALRHGIDNTPSAEHVANLRALCLNVLEPLRRRFGVLRITSGYRCPKLNALVGGSPASQHLRGEAADIHTGGREASEKIYEYAMKYLTYDQLLLEHVEKTGTRWLHVSWRRDGRQRRTAQRISIGKKRK